MSIANRGIRLFVFSFVDGVILLPKLFRGELDVSEVKVAGVAVNV